MIFKYLLALLSVVIVSPLCSADAFASEPVEQMRSCFAEIDDALRLKCYDQIMAELGSESTGTARQTASDESGTLGDETGPMPPSPSVTQESAEDEFGLKEMAARDAAKSTGDKSGELKQISSTVAAISRRPHGQLLITLENGQVWEETRASSGLSLEAGDNVIIKRRLLGSFSLTGPTGRYTRVKRVK